MQKIAFLNVNNKIVSLTDRDIRKIIASVTVCVKNPKNAND